MLKPATAARVSAQTRHCIACCRHVRLLPVPVLPVHGGQQDEGELLRGDAGLELRRDRYHDDAHQDEGRLWHSGQSVRCHVIDPGQSARCHVLDQGRSVRCHVIDPGQSVRCHVLGQWNWLY